MKKYLTIFFTIFTVLFLLVSCSSTKCYWEFKQELSNISEVCIVNIDYFDNGSENITILKEFSESEYEYIFNEVKNIEMSSYYGNLKTPSGNAIKISFFNGEYDIISCVEPKHYLYCKKEQKILGENSYLRCDNEQFNVLIESFLDK